MFDSTAFLSFISAADFIYFTINRHVNKPKNLALKIVGVFFFFFPCRDLNGIMNELKTRTRTAFVSHLHVVITTMQLLPTEEVSGTRTSVHHRIFSVIFIVDL